MYGHVIPATMKGGGLYNLHIRCFQHCPTCTCIHVPTYALRSTSSVVGQRCTVHYQEDRKERNLILLVQEELECCGAEPVVYWVDEPETRVRVCVSSARETTRRLGRCVLAWHTNVCDQPGVNRGGFYEKSDRQVREQQLVLLSTTK